MPEREQRTRPLGVDLDEALLAEAAESLGTTTKRATINGASAEFVAAARRRRFV
ncbi:type II toxin-antitoxin system VapB family antitoxin [Streptomyces yangpuensis]|uniref:Type II toxin-antitoxin system VapB family antitoxin n=2 Tax=Streptomyces yangpuensis TaxID=1648182 RepID=A0ABY5PWB5_9ACTN|nr:type II toxin-antitoxin system VapB family antitoxin [Streptomyces yangpuensis]